MVTAILLDSGYLVQKFCSRCGRVLQDSFAGPFRDHHRQISAVLFPEASGLCPAYQDKCVLKALIRNVSKALADVMRCLVAGWFGAKTVRIVVFQYCQESRKVEVSIP